MNAGRKRTKLETDEGAVRLQISRVENSVTLWIVGSLLDGGDGLNPMHSGHVQHSNSPRIGDWTSASFGPTANQCTCPSAIFNQWPRARNKQLRLTSARPGQMSFESEQKLKILRGIRLGVQNCPVYFLLHLIGRLQVCPHFESSLWPKLSRYWRWTYCNWIQT